MTSIRLGKIPVQVTHKDIKNIHLSVYPPAGSVRISAPTGMKLDTIRVFALSKLAWIKKQQKKLREQERETLREYIDRESHYLWGKRYLLKVIHENSPPYVELKNNRILLHVRPGSDLDKRKQVMQDWYREQIKDKTRHFLATWEKKIKVEVQGFTVRRMKTKWGSCTPHKGTIRLNLELAKKPLECLEYIVVHEMAHILEPSHNKRFVKLMDKFMPKWEFYRDELNRLPVRHEEWGY